MVNYQNLTCNLAWTQFQGSSFKRRGYWSRFLPQIWISFTGWGWILGAGAALLGLGSKVGGGGFRRLFLLPQTLRGVSAVVTNCQMLGKSFWTPLTHWVCVPIAICQGRLSAANNQKEYDKADKSLIVDIRTLLQHQKRSVHWLIILATALICRGVILKKSET